MDPLERLVLRESVGEILARLRPGELVVALLRAEGMNDQEIGAMLGITPQAVSVQMVGAQERIAYLRPDLADLLLDRRMPRGPREAAAPPGVAMRDEAAAPPEVAMQEPSVLQAGVAMRDEAAAPGTAMQEPSVLQEGAAAAWDGDGGGGGC